MADSDSDNDSSSVASPQPVVMNDLNWNVPFANGDQLDLLKGAGLQCELKRYDCLFNALGDKQRLPMGSSRSINHDRDDSPASALVLTKHWNKDKELEYTELEIKSPYIKAALKAVVPMYRDFQILAKHIVLRNEPQCVFHFREELQQYGSRLQDDEAAKHVLFLLQYMWRELSAEIFTFYNTIGNPDVPAASEFQCLWMAFRPDDLIFVRPSSVFEEDRVLKFTSMDRCRCGNPLCWRDHWTIWGKSIDYDGNIFGYESHSIRIKRFEGCQPLHRLQAFPLRFHPESSDLRDRLIDRGKKFCGLHGMNYREYDGVAELLSDNRSLSLLGEEEYYPRRSTLVRGRIVVDGSAFEEARPAHTTYLSSAEKRFDPKDGEHLSMTDEEYIICSNTVRGYSLSSRRWGYFNVDRIVELRLNQTAFDSLIMNEHYKKQVLSLVRAHEEDGVDFDDVIQGKGKGLVFLLHGEPGVGKTLTAEAVADHCGRPLLRLDAACLGTSAEAVEGSLSSIFRFASRWKAVALLDEADVFLDQRQTNNVKHNALVAVFLRVLEYYEGILFLTTNRVDSFDAAFKSRIHLAIRYPKLGVESRRKLWHTFLSQTPESSADVLAADGTLDELAEEELNGRQIKNIVRTAYTLALSDKAPINRDHIVAALEPMKQFETELQQRATEKRKSDSPDDMVPQPSAKRPRTRDD